MMIAGKIYSASGNIIEYVVVFHISSEYFICTVTVINECLN